MPNSLSLRIVPCFSAAFLFPGETSMPRLMIIIFADIWCHTCMSDIVLAIALLSDTASLIVRQGRDCPSAIVYSLCGTVLYPAQQFEKASGYNL